jgi:hypothetical protein
LRITEFQTEKIAVKKLGAGFGSKGFTVSGLQSFHYTFSSCISSTFQPYNEANNRTEGKNLARRLKISVQKPAVEKGVCGRSDASPLPPFPSVSVDISFKDDVTVSLLLGVFFMIPGT